MNVILSCNLGTADTETFSTCHNDGAEMLRSETSAIILFEQKVAVEDHVGKCQELIHLAIASRLVVTHKNVYSIFNGI